MDTEIGVSLEGGAAIAVGKGRSTCGTLLTQFSVQHKNSELIEDPQEHVGLFGSRYAGIRGLERVLGL